MVRLLAKHVELTKGFSNYVREELLDLINHYELSPLEILVTFSRPFEAFSSEISCHVGKGAYLRAHSEGGTLFFAFDNAFGKLKRNLQKYKKRLVDHHRHRDVHDHGQSPEERFASLQEMGTEPETEKEAENHVYPAVIAESSEKLPVMTLSDALATMELEGLAAFLFRNVLRNNAITVLYKRPDEHYGWIDLTLQV